MWLMLSLRLSFSPRLFAAFGVWTLVAGEVQSGGRWRAHRLVLPSDLESTRAVGVGSRFVWKRSRSSWERQDFKRRKISGIPGAKVTAPPS